VYLSNEKLEKRKNGHFKEFKTQISVSSATDTAPVIMFFGYKDFSVKFYVKMFSYNLLLQHNSMIVSYQIARSNLSSIMSINYNSTFVCAALTLSFPCNSF